jgi:hypothetical protein
MTRWFWEQTGGLLIEEFPLVQAGPGNAARFADGLIVLDEPAAISTNRDFNIEGHDVMVIQTKAKRLGMYLLGQTVFSLELVLRLQPKSARAVALCSQDDSVMRFLLESRQDCSVVVCPYL